jgi:hypothetical protein
MEALGLGLFMISAGGFGTLLEYPGSPVHQAIANPFARRALMGLAMGLTGRREVRYREEARRNWHAGRVGGARPDGSAATTESA